MRKNADDIKKEDITLDDFGTWITDELKEARIEPEEDNPEDAENNKAV